MDVSRPLAAALLAITLATVTPQSHDNILRVQLWDAEGLSREPITTESSVTSLVKKSTVDLNLLYNAMLGEDFAGFGRFTRHKVRHKRRRARRSEELPWRFHQASSVNVAEYDGDTPWSLIENGSAVSDSVKEVAPAMYLQDNGVEVMKLTGAFSDNVEEEKVKKQLPVVPKCCASGQNLTVTVVDGSVKSVCTRSSLTFQPSFYQANETHMWSYDSNVFETIVGNPCADRYRYKLEPDKSSEDEFYLLVNGSLFVPYSKKYLLGTREYCMETFWNESNPAGVTLPLVCFESPVEVTKTSTTLIVYAIGLIISVPFLLATACVYLFIRELRDTHGKALACHSVCLALAFSCLAATQLAGHAFPTTACTVMAYLIQFSFVSCFFWLNVMCFDIYLNVKRYINSSVSRRSMRRRFAWYCVYAIVLPVVLLVVTITMDLSPAVPSTYLKPNFGVKGCWFKTDQAALPYFYGPLAAILLSNLIIFLLTSRAFAKHYDKFKDVTPLDMTHSDFSTTDDWVRLGLVLGAQITTLDRTASPPPAQGNFNQRLKKYRKIFRTCCMLSIIMGISWVLEVVSWAVGAGSEVMSVWSVFDLINALQGVVIFAIFVMQQPVRSYVKFSKLSTVCRKRRNGSEVSVVSERNSIDCGTSGKRDYV